MDLTKLKEQAKRYATSNKTWRKSLQTILSWAEKDLLWDEIMEYEKRKNEAERKIEELIWEKQEKLTKFKEQQDAININLTSKIAAHIDFLEKEKAQIDELTSWTSALVENLPDFHKSFQENIDKINDFIGWLNELNREIRKDADSCVQEYKKEIKKEIDQKKWELNTKLIEYYEDQKKAIENNLNNEENWWHLKQYLWKEWGEASDNMKKKWLFVGYTIIILLSIFIVFIDYFLIQKDVVDTFWLNRSSNWISKIIFNYIIPGIFSFWILMFWIVERKMVESKFWKFFDNFLIYTSSAVLLVLPAVIGLATSNWTFTRNDILFWWEWMKILWRFFIYFMLLPLCIYLIGKFITWEYMHVYISTIIYWIKWVFKKLFYPFGKLFGLFERKMLVNVSWFWIKFRWRPMNELEEKTEHLNVLYNNVNKIDKQVRDIKTKCNIINKWLKWSNKVFNERVNNLNDNLKKTYREVNREIEELERIKKQSIAQIDSQINQLAEWLWMDEENLSEAREAIKDWILEVYNE